MIYILCPANFASGGPELLHQLGYKLRLLGFEAVMYYWNQKAQISPICNEYLKYNVPYTQTLSDKQENIVIIPEVVIPIIHSLFNIKKVIWWLSVDNAKYTLHDMDVMRSDKHIIHFCQSHYAIDFLLQNDIENNRIKYLSDYINTAFLMKRNKEERDDIIVFNPRKGFDVTSSLIEKSCARIKWQALSGLTPDGMRDVMEHAKIYIDFGNHPGKDRIPREAALSGCIVVTNCKGSAKNTIDVPIKKQYKFENTQNITSILESLYKMIHDYKNLKEDFEEYKTKTKREFQDFEKDILKLFKELTNKQTEFLPRQKHIQNILEKIYSESYQQAFRFFVEYKLQYPEENVESDIIETNIRIGIGELYEAEYCAMQGIKKDKKNYELYLLLAQVHTILGKDMTVISKWCLNAMKYSAGTSDEQYVNEICNNILNQKLGNN